MPDKRSRFKISNSLRDNSVKNYENKIRIWLSEIFNLPNNVWKLQSLRINLYSHSYIYYQNYDSKVPAKIFIKCMNSNNIERDIRHFNNETNAFKTAIDIKDSSNVRIPLMYGENTQLRSVAMEYMPGESFFNVLWNSNRNRFFLGRTKGRNLILLKNIAEWLSKFHACGAETLHNVNQLESIIKYDLEEIEKRYIFLRNKKNLLISGKVIDNAIEIARNLSKKISILKQDLVYTHGDFTLANIINNKNEILVIDYSMYKIGLREADIARILTDFINIEVFNIFKNKSSNILENDLLKEFIESYGYVKSEKANDILMFYLIKNAIINLTMYIKSINGKKNMQKLHPFIFLFSQKNLLKKINNIYKE